MASRQYRHWTAAVCGVALAYFASSCGEEGPTAPITPATPAIKQSGWFWQNPVPAGVHLRAVDMTDPTTIWAAGSFGTIVTSRDGGATWTLLASQTSAHIEGIDMVNRRVGYAVGGDGVGVRTRDGGATWTPFDVGSVDPMRAVSFLNENVGLVVGDGGFIARTTNGGETWAQVLDAGVHLLDVHFVDAEFAVAVGFGNAIWRSESGGSLWASISVPSAPALLGVRFVDRDTGLAVGVDGECFRTTDGGLSWEEIDIGATQNLTGVTLANGSTEAIVVAEFGGGVFRSIAPFDEWSRQTNADASNRRRHAVAHAAGTTIIVGHQIVLSESNSSPVVRPISQEIDRQPIAVDMLNNTHGLIAGSDGVILRTTNGGATWEERESGTTLDIIAVDYVDVNTAVVVGRDGFIARTEDAGATWVHQSQSTSLNFTGVHFLDALTGFVVGDGGITVRTTDGGATWTSSNVIGPSLPTFTLHDVVVLNDRLVVAVGDAGHIATSLDFGSSWLSTTVSLSLLCGTSNPSLVAVAFADESEGWAVGNCGAVVRTTSGGVTWKAVPTIAAQLAVELRGVSSPGPGRVFVVGDDAFVMAQAATGEPWQLQTVRNFNDIYDVSFPSENTGTLIGAFGTIMRTVTGGVQ